MKSYNLRLYFILFFDKTMVNRNEFCDSDFFLFIYFFGGGLIWHGCQRAYANPVTGVDVCGQAWLGLITDLCASGMHMKY